MLHGMSSGGIFSQNNRESTPFETAAISSVLFPRPWSLLEVSLLYRILPFKLVLPLDRPCVPVTRLALLGWQ
jgi:hypothetical protein